MLPAVTAVDVLDDLFTTVRLNVDIDVWRAITFGRQEPFEQQPQRDRVGICYAQGVTHCGVRRRPSPLAQDVGSFTERHDVGDDQEVSGEPQGIDHFEFSVQLGIGAGDHFIGWRSVAFVCAAASEFSQPGHLIVALWARVRRQIRGHELQIECTLPGDLDRCVEHSRKACKTFRLLISGTQMRCGSSRQPSVVFFERPTMANRRQRCS